jgi:ubiquinone/menaquinone biosynthesis C-methylase UbiE
MQPAPSLARGEVMLTREQARRFYDRFGAKQDAQWFYESPPVTKALEQGAFQNARSVFEFGCGTGHVAEMLLDQYLAPSATYEGCDLSTTMITLARRRLAKFGDRAKLSVSDGTPHLSGVGADRFDRFVSNYVVDLLATEDIAVLIDAAHRVLRPNGRLCLVSLTFGVSPMSHSMMWLWQRLHALRPQLVGGCRPVRLTEFLSVQRWRVAYQDVFVAYGIPSEVLVADKL